MTGHTGPYMHNGRLMSLFEVVKFYSEGGDVPLDREHNPDKHPENVPFKITNEQNSWQGAMRLLDKSGAPLKDLKIKLSP